MGPTLKLRGHHETKTQTAETRQEPVHRQKTTEKPRAQPEAKTQPTETQQGPVRHEKTEKPRDHHEQNVQTTETWQEPISPLPGRRQTADYRDLLKMQAIAARQEAARNEKTEKPRDHHEQDVQTTEDQQEPIFPLPGRRKTADYRDLLKMQAIAARQEAARNEKTEKATDHHHEKNTQPLKTQQDPIIPTLRLRRETADYRDLEKMKTTETNRQEPAPLPTKPQTTTATATTAPAKPAVLVKKTDKIRDFFEKKKQPTTETRQDLAPLPTVPQTTAAAPAAPEKSAVGAKTEGRGGQHETKTERPTDHHEMKTQPPGTRQDSAVPQPLKINKTRDHDETRTQKPGAQAEKTQTTETRQDPAPAPPRPSPAAQQTTATAANTAAAAPEMSAVMAKAALKSNEPHQAQSYQANVLERYNHTGDRQRHANVSDRNPFRSVSPMRKPTRNNLEGWSGREMNTSDWPPEESEVKEASKPAAAEPPQRPNVLAQVEECVRKVREGKGTQTPVEEITKIWHKIRRGDENEPVVMSDVPPTRKDDETAEKMERTKQEDELKKKFWEKLDRTLGLHQVRACGDRDGDKKRREKGRLSLLLAKILGGLMGLSFFGWVVTMFVLVMNQMSTDRLEFILWPVLTVVGFLFSAQAHARASENLDTARYDEEIARRRELQVERASRGLGPSKNKQQVPRVSGGAEGPGSNAIAAVPEAPTRYPGGRDGERAEA